MVLLFTGLGLIGLRSLSAAPTQVTFRPSAETVDGFDFLKVALAVAQRDAANPFTDVEIRGEFARAGAAPVKVDGFCDAADGRVFRIRFMPTAAGRHTYSVTYRQGEFTCAHPGEFTARGTKRRGQ